MFQPVVAHVRMEGRPLKGTVHVTVQMATMGLPVKVSAVCGVQKLIHIHISLMHTLCDVPALTFIPLL